MTLQEINIKQSCIYQMLGEKRLHDAFQALKPLVEATSDYRISERYAHTKTAYDFLLQYLTAGVDDPRRDIIFKEILRDLYGITDSCVIILSANQSYDLFFSRAQSLQNESVTTTCQAYLDVANRCALLESVADKELRNEKVIFDLRKEQERRATHLFNKVWCTYPLSNTDVEALSNLLFGEKEVDAQVQALVVSALFVGLTKFYDEAKLLLLIDTYISNSKIEVQSRALTATMMVMLLHPQRIDISAHIAQRLDTVQELPYFKNDFTSIIHRLVRSRNTENVSKLMRDELLPGIMKMSPDMIQKMRNNTGGMFDPAELEANPEWQDWLDKSGINKKMEHLNQMQTQGDDVFISTFAQLKSFPFFNNMANWFLPYSPQHTALEEAFAEPERKLLEMVRITPYMCDSDKYSFSFSLHTMPEQQLQYLSLRLDEMQAQMSELEGEHLPDNDTKKRDAIINNYIQSLYRFFKLFSRRADFPSLFNTSINLFAFPSEVIERGWLDTDNLWLIAEFYLKNGFYDDAIAYFSRLEQQPNCAPIVQQKLGFAYQNRGQYQKALHYYRHYELFNDSDTWNLQHIAACYRALKHYDKALTYYRKALQLNDNISLNLNAGHCCLETKQYDEALKYYYKAHYLAPNNTKVWRALAWTLFVAGNYEQSENFHKKLMALKGVTAQDRLNYGHLLLCTNRLPEALQCYTEAASGDDKSLANFVEHYTADMPVLQEKGLNPNTAILIKEAIIKAFDDRQQPN